MSSTRTADEMFNSLTGFDEVAIAKYFGQQLQDLIPNKDKATGKTSGQPFGFLRALAFVHMRREGVPDRDAFSKAQSLSIAEANGYFPDAEPEADPDDPDTEAGKDDEPSA